MTLRASFILLNYNTASLSLAALDSLNKYIPDLTQHQIIVVDNASEADDLACLKQGLADRPELNVEFFRSRINSGFGAGHMTGVQLADGDVYFFLNSDVQLTMDIVTPALEFFETHADAGMVGGQILGENGSRDMSFFNKFSWGSEVFGDSVMARFSPGNYRSREATYQSPIAVGSVVGALMIWRADDFDALGGFDPHLFLYYEEKDLGLRLARELNQKAYFLPQLEYVHLGSKSTEPSTAIAVEFKLSRLYMTRKHLGLLGHLFLLVRSIPFTAIKALYKPKYRSLLRLYLSGGSLSKSLRQHQTLRSK
jgi:GT2 family glycosyltransferase